MITEEQFKAAKPVWDAQLVHPFVEGIGDGTLEVERFKRWVLQDYLYLKDFARLFAWAVAKADRLESMSWYATVLNLTLNTEMALHRAYAARFGITADELERQEMWPTNRPTPISSSGPRRTATWPIWWPRSCPAPGATCTSRSS